MVDGTYPMIGNTNHVNENYPDLVNRRPGIKSVSPRISMEENSPLIEGGIQEGPFNGSIPTLTGRTSFNSEFTMYWVATASSLMFTSTVWYIVLSAEHEFFIWHPIFMSTTLFLLTQGPLLLQTAETREEKEKGLNVHRSIQSLAFLTGICGFYIIYTNKKDHNAEHFTSAHGMFGVLTLSLIFIQVLGGALVVNAPALFGGVARARGIYKYHRISGYTILLFAWLTALGGTQRDWVTDRFNHIWFWLLAFTLTWIGIGSRVKLNKMKVL
ncbi:5617_t:CDS:2 [Ambispora gerdemannii]|uniref:5617_t:CDS:1 n=1 Tax=Ambispora gerdemannii TaxID=144530 RepID=A0A9N9A384_9GLOM|nr:5617_t:CDS:2 [Ambispora gerdemannii]